MVQDPSILGIYLKVLVIFREGNPPYVYIYIFIFKYKYIHPGNSRLEPKTHPIRKSGNSSFHQTKLPGGCKFCGSQFLMVIPPLIGNPYTCFFLTPMELGWWVYPLTRWWQLKYFSCSPRSLVKWTNLIWLIFFKGVETTNWATKNTLVGWIM